MKDMSFAVASYAQDGNMLYFSSQDNIGLYVLDMDTLEIQCKNIFPFHNFNARFLWGKALRVERDIWFSPFYYMYPSLCYDIEKNAFSPIEHSETKERQPGHPYCYMARYGNKVYIFPIKERQVLVYSQNKELIKRVVLDIDADLLTMNAAVDKNKVYLPVSNSNGIIEFDMETLLYSHFRIGTEDIQISNIIFIEGCLYFSSRNCAELYCYDPEKKVLTMKTIGNKGSQIDSLRYDGQNIWGTILYEDKMFKTDIQLGLVEFWDIPVQKCPLPDNCLWRKNASLNYRYMIDYGNSWYITSDYENAIYVFDRIENKFRNRISICVSQDIEEVALLQVQMERFGIIKEDKDKDLKNYLEMIKMDRGDMIWKV